MWFTVKWRPKLLFSLTLVKSYLHLAGDSGIGPDRCNLHELSTLMIGKLYPASMLGYYTKRTGFPKCACVEYRRLDPGGHVPAYAKNQDSISCKANMRRATDHELIPGLPCHAGLQPLQSPWSSCCWPRNGSRVFHSFRSSVRSMHSGHPYSKSSGDQRSRTQRHFLRLEIIKKVVGLSVLAVTVPIGIYAWPWE